MKRTENTVFFPPTGLVVALQYWEGDEHRAMRLARIIADVEVEPRGDVVLALCRASTTPKTRLALETFHYCSRKFRVMTLQSDVAGDGYPDGANALWGGTFSGLYRRWRAGNLSAASVFFIESDGVPIRRDWLTRIKTEHELNVLRGRRVTGSVTTKNIVHVNGNLVSHLSVWGDRMSLHETPSGQAWDVFHAASLMQEAADTPLIRNVYGSTDWSPGVIEAVQHETAYLANVKDDTAIDWAERELVDDTMPEQRDLIPIHGVRG